MYARLPRRFAASHGILLTLATVSAAPALANQPQIGRAPIVHQVQESNERLEMIANSSKILTLDEKIPQAQVNNPEILELTPLSPTQIQVFAKKPGVTQVNLWNERQEVKTVDVIVYGDAQELAMLLRSQFPNSALKVIPLANSVIVSGHVDNPTHVRRIIEIAEDYHPKVINNITVGGVQQVMLHIKVMEVNRSKLRDMGFDFSTIIDGTNFVTSSAGGFLAQATTGTGNLFSSTGGETIGFGIVNGDDAFFGILRALRDNNCAKILAEPTLVTVSGRPAEFVVGGETPILVPQSLGTIAIEYKDFGTEIDFVPIVLGDGNIRLEVRPSVSEIDDAAGIDVLDIHVPGFRTRRVDTGVDMRTGQTLAIAGLIQTRETAQVRGLPFVSELPYVGAAFRRTRSEVEEIEMLVFVTPQLVEAMDAEEVPPCGPGTMTESPSDCDLYWKGHVEVPRCTGCERCPGESASPYGYGMPAGEGVPSDVEAVPPPSVPMPGEPTASKARRLQGHTAVHRNSPTRPHNRSHRTANAKPTLIGPVGYDVQK